MTIREPLEVSALQPLLRQPHFWMELTRLTEMMALYTPRRWFIRYGDDNTEAQLRLARHLQSIDEYTRARLSQPARSYLAERHLLQQQAGTSQGMSAFLELVMGFSCDVHQLRERSQHLQFLSQQANGTPQWEIHIAVRPDEIACHTPLNQRLLTANFDLCQWFTTALLQLKPKQIDQINKQLILGISTAVFQRICDSLELQKQEQMQILAFGRHYLAQYLEVSLAELHSDPALPKRVKALAHLESKARNASSGDFHGLQSPLPGRQWLSEQHQTGWFFFPESFWMQYHWFNSFIGLDLGAEIALIDALVVAGDNQIEC